MIVITVVVGHPIVNGHVWSPLGCISDTVELLFLSIHLSTFMCMLLIFCLSTSCHLTAPTFLNCPVPLYKIVTTQLVVYQIVLNDIIGTSVVFRNIGNRCDCCRNVHPNSKI